MSEHQGMYFDLRKIVTPECAVHEEYLRDESQVIANGLLQAVKLELASKIYKEVKSFLERKKFLPNTAKDVYRNITPIELRSRFSGDSLDDFLNHVEIEVKWRL